jgi:quinoprotein glucose dehydrogenase
MLYVETHRSPYVIALRRPMPFEQEYDWIGSPRPLLGPGNLPIVKPPYASLVAIDMNSGEQRWRVPLGTGPTGHFLLQSLAIKERLGNPWAKGWALVTRSLLFVVQAGVFINPQPSANGFGRTYSLTPQDTNLWAYDKATGELLAEIPVGSNASGAPMTYLLDGRQYIVFPVGGGRNVPEELIAVGLPAGG